MKVVMDGIIYRLQSRGGISRIYSEILPRMCDMDTSLRILLLTERKLLQSLPVHMRIFHWDVSFLNSYLPAGWARNLVVPRANRFIYRLLIGQGAGQIWHSTYYTLPKRWYGWQVVTVADMIYERFENISSDEDVENFRTIKRKAISRADKIIAISQATKEDLKKFLGVADEKIQVIHLGCNPVFQKMPGQKWLGKPFVLFVGGRAGYKNFEGLLQAFSIWPKNRDVDLVAVGPDWTEEESKKIIALNLLDKVRLIPYPDDLVLRDLYNQALAFLYPSLYEGFGIPLLESMSCGCPIIASRIPSTVEIAGDVPLYHDPGNLEQMVFNLDQACSESKFSERIARGTNLAKSFSWERTARKTLELYRNLIQ
ncbi:MAG: glycosyltransferase family 1 protein [Anaerolineales bacterium]|jgi:glycosyltransferase involved in cell wall biosynthesis